MLREDFFSRLHKRKNSLTVFNPYRLVEHLDNLRVYLDAVFAQQGERIMLVGEAPGYKGCRLTGIPFSSVQLLKGAEHPFLKRLRPQLVLPDGVEVAENTASVVWQHLLQHEQVPLFWNAFPFHPHPSRIQRKNRAPNKKEIQEGSYFLESLVAAYQPSHIAGLGRAGQQALQLLFPEQEIVYIRHPSYGGKADFIRGINGLYALALE